jgi:hypothetical protein
MNHPSPHLHTNGNSSSNTGPVSKVVASNQVINFELSSGTVTYYQTKGTDNTIFRIVFSLQNTCKSYTVPKTPGFSEMQQT